MQWRQKSLAPLLTNDATCGHCEAEQQQEHTYLVLSWPITNVAREHDFELNGVTVKVHAEGSAIGQLL